MTWLMLALGLVLLIIGADLLVKGAAKLARSFGIPALIIGLTVVAFGTSAPELAVSVKAAWSGQAELAIANVVGSNIFNVLFILGLAALISPLIISRQLIRQDVPIMVGLSVVLLLMTLDGTLEKWEAGVFILGLFVYTFFLFKQGKKQSLAASNNESTTLLDAPSPTWKNLLLIGIGLALLVLGARWLVDSAIDIALAFGVNEAVIGLTIVAAGTSLPEVLTSIIATIKGERDIAVGNVVGSNIFNILCVLGLSGLVSPTPLMAGEQMSQLDIPVMVGVALVCIPFFFIGARLSRIEGLLFLALYVAYTWYLIALALKQPYLLELRQGIVYGLLPLVLIYIVFSFVHSRKKQTPTL